MLAKELTDKNSSSPGRKPRYDAHSTNADKRSLHIATVISDIATPVSIFHQLSKGSAYAFLLESAEGDNRLARYSFIGVDPAAIISLSGGKADIEYTESGLHETVFFDDPLKLLEETLNDYRQQLDESAVSLPPFPFSGGLVGYMGYGAAHYFEGIELQKADPHAVPEGVYGLYDSLIVFDHHYRSINVLSRRSREHAEALAKRISDCAMQLQPLRLEALAQEPDIDALYRHVSSSVTKETYLQQVHQCQELIQAGEVFQIVLSQRFSLPLHTDGLNVYRILQALNPSPYAYILRYPGFDYIGSSPETFVRCNGADVMLRAIAGTRPRGKCPAEDLELEQELRRNEKENAEHMMLVDLGRNDLGRISRVGSVKVGEIAMLTRYAHVMHLSTELSGCLEENKNSFDVFRSCFPRGTVSGAPKIRAMQHLAKIEPEQRGIYSGVVGYFGFDGNMDGAIAIRSALLKDGWAHVNAGAGIVLDSDPLAEYEETRIKARSVVKAVQTANELGASVPRQDHESTRRKDQ